MIWFRVLHSACPQIDTRPRLQPLLDLEISLFQQEGPLKKPWILSEWMHWELCVMLQLQFSFSAWLPKTGTQQRDPFFPLFFSATIMKRGRMRTGNVPSCGVDFRQWRLHPPVHWNRLTVPQRWRSSSGRLPQSRIMVIRMRQGYRSPIRVKRGQVPGRLGVRGQRSQAHRKRGSPTKTNWQHLVPFQRRRKWKWWV